MEVYGFRMILGLGLSSLLFVPRSLGQYHLYLSRGVDGSYGIEGSDP